LDTSLYASDLTAYHFMPTVFAIHYPMMLTLEVLPYYSLLELFFESTWTGGLPTMPDGFKCDHSSVDGSRRRATRFPSFFFFFFSRRWTSGIHHGRARRILTPPRIITSNRGFESHSWHDHGVGYQYYDPVSKDFGQNIFPAPQEAQIHSTFSSLARRPTRRPWTLQI
jgi:hypothetical protein